MIFRESETIELKEIATVDIQRGTNQTIFKDCREFTGLLMQQINEVYEFIDFRNQTCATIEKLLRKF